MIRAALLIVCVSAPALATSPPAGVPRAGHWAGDGMVIDAAPDRVRLTLDCAAGSMAAPVTLDGKGHFNASGSFNVFQPGPQRADEPIDDKSAQFSGVVNGDRLALALTRPGAPVQRFQLVKDRPTKLLRCL